MKRNRVVRKKLRMKVTRTHRRANTKVITGSKTIGGHGRTSHTRTRATKPSVLIDRKERELQREQL